MKFGKSYRSLTAITFSVCVVNIFIRQQLQIHSLD